MKKTKVIAFLLSCAIMCTALVGCTSIFPSGKSFGTVAGKPINIDLYESYIRYQLSMLTQQGATPDQIRELLNKEENGKKGSDSLKESVLNYVSTIVAVEKLAKENNIEITADDKAAIKKDKDSIVEQYQGRAKFVEALKEQHMTEEVFDMLAVHSKLLEKVQKALFNEGGKYAPSKEDVTKKILDGNIRAIHILVQAQSTDKDFA
ncbi:MAG: hypothetical protein RR994_02945, partial [Clostridia bacterium]